MPMDSQTGGKLGRRELRDFSVSLPLWSLSSGSERRPAVVEYFEPFDLHDYSMRMNALTFRRGIEESPILRAASQTLVSSFCSPLKSSAC